MYELMHQKQELDSSLRWNDEQKKRAENDEKKDDEQKRASIENL